MSVEQGPGDGTWSVFAEKVVKERDKARAERDDAEKRALKAEKKMQDVANYAIAFLGSELCERHSAEVRTLPFHEFFNRVRGRCVLCLEEQVKVLEARTEKAERKCEELRNEVEEL